MAATAAAGAFPLWPADIALNDKRRAREFYHYLQPDDLVHPDLGPGHSTFGVSSDDVPSLSNALAPFCQLTALRCKCRKSMVNVIDRDIMHFLAEATKISSREGENTYEFVEDPILMRCSSVPLKGRICELTIALDNTDGSQPTPMFVIPDLTHSDFSQMEIVTGPPYYRFYAGVPITTREGINIGSLAVMDTSSRPNGLTKAEEHFLAHSVRQIMLHLEINRQAIEGQRCRRMAEGLEAFIAGKTAIQPPGHLSEKSLKRRSKLASGTDPPMANGTQEHPPYLGDYKLHAGNSNSVDSIEHEASTSGQS
ncbi:hypothetical protein LTR93_012285, partial [Exophiala xenobiotica]